MPTDRPNLVVAAQPVNTFVAPVAAAAELYDQQTVNLALQFSEAFKDFSLTAANFASVLKKENNQEQINAGIDLINKNQKSYLELVNSGQIKPSENPWMALGAQQASGQIEGTRARADFTNWYNKQAESDPTFFDNPDKFNALAASYAENKAKSMSDAPYMSRSFFESFDPYIGSMRLKHEEQMMENRKQVVMEAVSAAAVNAISDSMSPDENISKNAAGVLQEMIDEKVKQGFNAKEINKTVAEALVRYQIDGEDPEKAQAILESLKAGTGRLIDVPAIRALVAQNKPKIDANLTRLTNEKVQVVENEFFGPRGVVDRMVSGEMSREEGLQMWEDFIDPTKSGRMRVTPGYNEEVRRRIASQFDSRMAAAERQSEQDRREEVLRAAIDLSSKTPNEFGAGFNEDEGFVVARQQLDEVLTKNKASAAETIQAINFFEGNWKDNAKQRYLRAVQDAQHTMWHGGKTETGLSYNYAKAVNAVFNGKDENGAPLRILPMPKLAEMKMRIDADLRSRGITEQSDKAKVNDAYAYAQSQFYDILDQQVNSILADRKDFGGTLAPMTSDSEATRQAKADVRARVSLLKTQVGMYFGNKDELARAADAFHTGLSTVSENVPWQMEDVLRAYTIGRVNNIPVEELIIYSPTSPMGKRMIEILEYMKSSVQAGSSPADAIRDAASREFFGTKEQINFFNSKGYTMIDLSTSDADKTGFGLALSAQIDKLGITNTDSIPYFVSQYKNAYATKMQTHPNHPAGIRAADGWATDKVMVFRGSALPNDLVSHANKDNPQRITSDMLEFWMDKQFPGQNATLVYIQDDEFGRPMLAVRNPNGASIAGAKPFYTPDDISIKTVELKPYVEFVKQAQERRTKAVDKVGSGMWWLDKIAEGLAGGG